MNNNKIIIGLLLLIIIIIVIIVFLLNKVNKKKKENYQFAALSAAEKGIYIAEKIKKAIELYNRVKQFIPKIKKILESE